MKMEQTECSETSAYKIQTSGNYPEVSIQQNKQVVYSSRHTLKIFVYSCFNNDMLWSNRPPSGHLTETYLTVLAVQIRSVGYHNTNSCIKIYVKHENCIILCCCIAVWDFYISN